MFIRERERGSEGGREREREGGRGGLAGEHCLSVYKPLERTKTHMTSAHRNKMKTLSL